MTSACAYVEHVAIRVKDIHWHIRFFKDVFGMDVREVDGPVDNPRQYWTVGGIQLMATPDLNEAPTNDQGWLAHLGIMVTDLEDCLRKAYHYEVTELPQGLNWIALPDGLALELIQASPNSVEKVLAVDPRAPY
ncbi:MAG: VOC family protein [Pontibacterium sp.]